MYSTQRVYAQGELSCGFLKKSVKSIGMLFDSLHRGIEAARIAQKNPMDKERILKVLSED